MFLGDDMAKQALLGLVFVIGIAFVVGAAVGTAVAYFIG